jgi:hypothetical protein
MHYSFASRWALVLLAGSVLSCKKEPEAPVTPFAYSFQLLNEQGQQTAVFGPEQNIVFRFLVENRSDQDMYLANPLFEGEHFLEVYQLGSGQPQSMGKPYQDLCLTYQAYYILLPHSSRSFTVPWMKSAQYPDVEPFCTHAATTWLPAGHYSISFSPRFIWQLEAATPTTTVPAANVSTQEFDVR